MKYLTAKHKQLMVRSSVSVACMTLLCSPIFASPVLPDPTDVINGIPVTIQYDDGYSYSTRVLDYLFPLDGWDQAAGTGTLDVIVTTRSAGQTNPAPLPDPTTNPNINPINDSWGTSATTGDLLVKDLNDYLQTNFATSTPAFTFDQNETGGNPDLYASAKIEILDGDGTTVLYTWALDNLFQSGDGDYDPASPVLAPGSITIPDIYTPDPLDTITFSNNVGSGKFDYIILFPTMDLSIWADSDNLFKLSWIFGDVDNGGEEITITAFTQDRVVPEPSLLALLGLGLLLMPMSRRWCRI
jgi:hypothetical protein